MKKIRLTNAVSVEEPQLNMQLDAIIINLRFQSNFRRNKDVYFKNRTQL